MYISICESPLAKEGLILKPYFKFIMIGLFVVITGIFHSCSMDKEDSEVVIEKEQGRKDEKSTKESMKESEKETICVYITGCVANPGVYDVSLGTRLYRLIELAGGLTAEADESYLNLADTVNDGDKIVVYSAEEVFAMAEQEGADIDDAGSALVNINTAGIDQLMTLPGIGQSKASAIINYREENGKFSEISEIMNISGIKEGAFNKIKDLITV